MEAGIGLKQVSIKDTIIRETCPKPASCEEIDNYYRKIDGSCNNLKTPNLGKSMTQFQRIIPPKYADGINKTYFN